MALIGAAVGAGVGVAAGLAAGDDTEGWWRFTAAEKAAFGGVALGLAGIGALAAPTTDRWAVVPLVGPGASPSGGAPTLILGARFQGLRW